MKLFFTQYFFLREIDKTLFFIHLFLLIICRTIEKAPKSILRITGLQDFEIQYSSLMGNDLFFLIIILVPYIKEHYFYFF